MAVPAPGRHASDVVQFAASSDATATLSGIAALAWSQHPEWTRVQLKRRLLESGSAYPQNTYTLGRGSIDAWNATGGLAAAGIRVPQTITPHTAFTASAWTQGDGPFAFRWNSGETTPSIAR